MANKKTTSCQLRSVNWLENCKILPVDKFNALCKAAQTTWGIHWSVIRTTNPAGISKYTVIDANGTVCSKRSIGISHSHLNSCIITADSQYVAVDIEPITRLVKWRKFKRLLSNSEWQILEQCADPAVANDIFLSIWTLKEAIVKALHKGIANQFPRIEVRIVKISDCDYAVNDIVTDITTMQLYWHSCVIKGHKLAIAMFE